MNDSKLNEVPSSFTVSCSCGGEALSIDVLDEYAYLNIFYRSSKSIHRTLLERIRNAWYVLIGKDYKVLELIFTVSEIKKQFQKFIDEH